MIAWLRTAWLNIGSNISGNNLQKHSSGQSWFWSYNILIYFIPLNTLIYFHKRSTVDRQIEQTPFAYKIIKTWLYQLLSLPIDVESWVFSRCSCFITHAQESSRRGYRDFKHCYKEHNNIVLKIEIVKYVVR